MANRFQKMFFNLSTLSPIAFVAVIVWWIQCGNNEFAQDNNEVHFTAMILISIIGIFAAIFSFYSVFVVKKATKTLEYVPMSVATVKSKDTAIIVSIVTYLLPFASFIFKKYNWWIILGIGVIALLALILSNAVWPNPILFVWNYHFYEVSNINGGEEFSLISKKKSIKNSKTINNVITVWDYMLIEVTNDEI